MSALRFTDVLPPPPREGWPGRVSFEVPDGAFVAFATTPGVARSLIRLLVGLRTPAAGTVEVLGTRPAALSRWETQRFRSRLGVGFDDPAGLVSNLSLRMNLVVPMLYSGLADMRTARARAADALRAFGLERWADTRPADTPPEVRREAVVARAAVRQPELLILEEPVAGLRDDRARWILDYCRDHARTVVVASADHDGVPFEVADSVTLLDNAGSGSASHEVGVV